MRGRRGMPVIISKYTFRFNNKTYLYLYVDVGKQTQLNDRIRHNKRRYDTYSQDNFSLEI